MLIVASALSIYKGLALYRLVVVHPREVACLPFVLEIDNIEVVFAVKRFLAIVDAFVRKVSYFYLGPIV